MFSEVGMKLRIQQVHVQIICAWFKNTEHVVWLSSKVPWLNLAKKLFKFFRCSDMKC